MTAEEIIEVLRGKFGDRVSEFKPASGDIAAVVTPADLVEIATFLRDDERLRFEMLNCISGVDYLETDEKKAAKAGFDPHLEVLYHLSSFTHGHRFTLKVMLPRWKDDRPGELPEVPSLCEVWRAADWHEREVYDLSGVMFTGHPDFRRILTAEDWEGHPLRKDYEFPLEYHGIRCR